MNAAQDNTHRIISLANSVAAALNSDVNIYQVLNEDDAGENEFMIDDYATILETAILTEDGCTKYYHSTGSDGLSESISIVSFNLHRLNRSRQVVRELIYNVFPDVILLQEHWLTPGNLFKLNIDFPDYVVIGRTVLSRVH